MNGWKNGRMDGWMNGLMYRQIDEWMVGVEAAKHVGCSVLCNVAFVGTIINKLYPSIMSIYIADTPISHFNK
jgi:hypothetical protein